MKKLMLAAAAIALVVAGCGGDSASDTTVGSGDATTTTTASQATTTTVEPSSTTAAPTTTTEATTTTSEAPVDGALPETFLAITDDYAAVAVDTATGDVNHVYGQLANAADLEDAEEMSPNVLVGIWRIRDGSMVGLADCCEPAAGSIFYLPADGELGDSPYTGGASSFGWMLSPSPTQNLFANIGFAMVVEDPSVTADTGPGVNIDDPELGFPSGNVAWERDGSQMYWTTIKEGSTGLVTLDLAEGSPQYVAELSWVGDDQYLDGIGSQASGNLVGFLQTYGADSVIAETEGVVFTTAGELVATFGVETGSYWGGYNESGTRLIYVDGEGTVRWQGGGQSGTLAEGYVFASW